ncbi:MAG: acetyl-CoA carboxylase biotin carboxyl carrier protein subunit [Actinomycetota bacterium]|jgi:pyruvate/2-oxoglutarate dehydrogenase complex dihydrolipoamide acyltransferase (E2) component|nr:acetyl-CoA carboxylase biotin carboxyl carrier protein subunit [Actinomycetota bacterium]
MPGAVLALLAADGDAVRAGAPLVVVEAIKMEHRLVAPSAGTVELRVRVGDQVSVDAELAVGHRRARPLGVTVLDRHPLDRRADQPRADRRGVHA